jgi:hypothetical protein
MIRRAMAAVVATKRAASVRVVTRAISQKDVVESGKAAQEAELRRDFERHGLKFAVPADIKYKDERMKM